MALDEPLDGEEAEVFSLPDPDRSADPAVAAADRETARLVWEAARALSTDDYTLLDLHIRQGFEADELAGALNIAKGAVYTRLTRIRQSLAESVTALMLARNGRRDCRELDVLLTALPVDVSEREVKRIVTRHANACERCDETKRRVASPLSLFGSFAPVPLAADMKAAIWERVNADISVPRPQSHLFSRGLAGRAGFVALLGLILAGIFAAGLSARSPVPLATDPTDVRSITHTPGQPSTNREAVVVWSSPEGAQAYSILWDQEPLTLPDAVADLPGESTSTRSDELSVGEWYFHMRTLGPVGTWTQTVHVGPLMIVALSPSPTPAGSQRPEASATPATTPVPRPTQAAPSTTPVGSLLNPTAISEPTQPQRQPTQFSSSPTTTSAPATTATIAAVTPATPAPIATPTGTVTPTPTPAATVTPGLEEMPASTPTPSPTVTPIAIENRDEDAPSLEDVLPAEPNLPDTLQPIEDE